MNRKPYIHSSLFLIQWRISEIGDIWSSGSQRVVPDQQCGVTRELDKNPNSLSLLLEIRESGVGPVILMHTEV